MAGLNELQAVNLMLSNIGETPVATLTGSGDAYVSIAQTVLGETTRAVQEEGWEFNTDKDYEITPDISDNIVVADNVITMDTIPGGIDVTVRQGKLYNKEDHTFLFTDTSYFVEIIWEFEYIETPQYIRQYIATRAARIFSDRMQGDDMGAKLSADDEQHALIVAKRHDSRNADRTVFEDSTLYRMKLRGN
jgi:hypothetical protein